MEKQSKKSRRVKVFYTLQNATGKDVSIDLNNYRVICNKTGARKSFYHKYLHNLIQRKYNNNIDLFRTTYVSRAGRPGTSRATRIQQRIDRLRATIEQLQTQLTSCN